MIDLLKRFENDLKILGAHKFSQWLWTHYALRYPQYDYFWFEDQEPFENILCDIHSGLSAPAKFIVYKAVETVMADLRQGRREIEGELGFQHIYPVAFIANTCDNRSCLEDLMALLCYLEPAEGNFLDVVLFRDMLAMILEWLNIQTASGKDISVLRNVDQTVLSDFLGHCRSVFIKSVEHDYLLPAQGELLKICLLEQIWSQQSTHKDIADLMLKAINSYSDPDEYSLLDRYSIPFDGAESGYLQGYYDFKDVLETLRIYIFKFKKNKEIFLDDITLYMSSHVGRSTMEWFRKAVDNNGECIVKILAPNKAKRKMPPKLPNNNSEEFPHSFKQAFSVFVS